MYFDLTEDTLILSPEQPTGVSPALQERLRKIARDCVISPLEDGQRPTPEPDDSDYDCAIEALNVAFTDTALGIRDDAWPKAAFRLTYTQEYERAVDRARARLCATEIGHLFSNDVRFRVTVTVDGPDLIRLAFEDDLGELEAALNEQEPLNKIESPEDDVERARRF